MFIEEILTVRQIRTKRGIYVKKNAKTLIAKAAVTLFNQNGYTGTSIRDIAKKAGVNVANISYYFNNKHGLLEYCLTTFFEQYICEIEQGYLATIENDANEALKVIAKNILLFQSKNSQLTRFVLREVSIDSQVVREIMATYYMKERYYLKKVFEKGLNEYAYKQQSINYFIMQFKGLISMPYLNAYYVKEVLHLLPNENYFAERYSLEVEAWINHVFVAQYEVVAQ